MQLYLRTNEVFESIGPVAFSLGPPFGVGRSLLKEDLELRLGRARTVRLTRGPAETAMPTPSVGSEVLRDRPRLQRSERVR